MPSPSGSPALSLYIRAYARVCGDSDDPAAVIVLKLVAREIAGNRSIRKPDVPVERRAGYAQAAKQRNVRLNAPELTNPSRYQLRRK